MSTRTGPDGSRSGRRRRVLLLTAAAGALALLPAPVALADHTAEPSVVALVGSLQSELGCPNDWAPECPATRLTPVAGSPGLFEGTFDVPAGSYDYKVALGGAWDENYGSAGAPGGANISLTAPGGPVTFTYDHSSHVISDDLGRILGSEQSAHFLSPEVIAWTLGDDAASRTYRLFAAPDGGLAIEGDTIVGGTSYALSRDTRGLPTTLRKKFPHLAGYGALRLPTRQPAKLAALLRGQLVVAAFDADGKLVAQTGLQIPGVLDAAYPYASKRVIGPRWLGSRPDLTLWAPTARSVTLHLYSAGSGGTEVASVPLADRRDGVWGVTGDSSWKGLYYLFEVEVYVPETGQVERNLATDPYSLGLSENSERSLLVDLRDASLTPAGWRTLAKPLIRTPEQQAIYELHVRDFSISDLTVPAAQRGTYAAFTVAGSNGMKHLSGLADAGLTTVHLLPVNDIATIEEDRSAQETPQCDLESFPADSEEQQECTSAVAARDGFNWGYDPLHFTAPEGSYATEAEGTTRNREFREMVAGINRAGLRVVIDVVYNHTSDAGQNGRNDLDRIVPGYYHRLTPQGGAVETSTCCSNTATENAMMGKLMIDSVVTWARDYKVDGFRFDLMGHQPKSVMLEVRRALDRLTPSKDGVDGRKVFLYGEGWNFGEVANDARFVQATQANMAGTGIATFNDRLRDAVRGGGPFDGDPRVQGFASGLYTDPNGAEVNGTEQQQLDRLLLAHDQIKVGLTGNLRDYQFVDRTGTRVRGSQVDYNGSPAGYNADPQEAITYVEAHDNETLYDALAFKLPADTPMAERVRMQTVGLATTALGQGISFWHAGGELLRSKSLDRNSYDSGDWFNILDFTYSTNGFGRGLPPRTDNESKWDYMRPLLADPGLVPSSDDIQGADAAARDLLSIRQSSPLFRLGNASLIQRKLTFPLGGLAQTPGVLVMRLDDTVGPRVDPDRDGIVVVFNASDDAVTQTVPGTAGASYVLHPVQASGADPVVKGSTYAAATGSFTVPARTVAVFQD